MQLLCYMFVSEKSNLGHAVLSINFFNFTIFAHLMKFIANQFSFIIFLLYVILFYHPVSTQSVGDSVNLGYSRLSNLHF
jgi:hypothetical protein